MRKLALYLSSLITLFLIYGFVIFLKKIHYNQVNFNHKTDGIAVLTGGKGRINLGLELFNKNKNLRLIISGVDKKVSDKSILPNDIKNKSSITIEYLNGLLFAFLGTSPLENKLLGEVKDMEESIAALDQSSSIKPSAFVGAGGK